MTCTVLEYFKIAAHKVPIEFIAEQLQTTPLGVDSYLKANGNCAISYDPLTMQVLKPGAAPTVAEPAPEEYPDIDDEVEAIRADVAPTLPGP